MSEFRFLHAADIHLDSPMRGLEADPDAPVSLLREASRRAFRNPVDPAVGEGGAFVVIAGDLYDGDWEDVRTGLFFTEQAARLAAEDIALVMVAGNHDAASVITRRLRLPERITLLPHDCCQTLLFDRYGVAVHGQSFATRSVTEDLSRHYPQAVPGLFNIGLLHTSLTGRPGHANYAPATVEALVARGYDYWALGHVHAREVVHENPWIVFPGNLQGRQSRESGAKGASLVTVREGRVAGVEHRPLDVLRWCLIDVHVAGERNWDSVMARVGCALSQALDAAEGRPIAARVRLSGATFLHPRLASEPESVRQGVVAEGCQHGAGAVWIEAVSTSTTQPSDLEALRSRPDVVGQLAQILDDLIAEEGAELLGEYPDLLRRRMPGIALGDDHPLQQGGVDLLKQARELILGRLMQAA
jgi:DNA repair exonuclease SbcCD nuclease subunit